MPPRRIEVALPLPIRSTFTYSLDGPAPLQGTRVLVPFRRQERIGWVVGPGSERGPRKVRSVLDLLESEPSANPELMDLARWMAGYYLAPLGMVLRTLFPSALSDSSRDYLTLVPGKEEKGGTPRERRLLDSLARKGGEARVRVLRRSLGMGSIWPEIRRLAARGALVHQVVPPKDPPVRTQKVVKITRWLPDLAERDEIFGRAPRQREAYSVLEGSGGGLELSHT